MRATEDRQARSAASPGTAAPPPPPEGARGPDRPRSRPPPVGVPAVGGAAGVVWGAVSTLPKGVAVGDPVSDPNLLNNLGTQTDKKWFFALTYSFIDTKDRLQKPFADAPTG